MPASQVSVGSSWSDQGNDEPILCVARGGIVKHRQILFLVPAGASMAPPTDHVTPATNNRPQHNLGQYQTGAAGEVPAARVAAESVGAGRTQNEGVKMSCVFTVCVVGAIAYGAYRYGYFRGQYEAMGLAS